MEAPHSSAVSPEIRELYEEMYRGGVERQWRDLGAVDKASNIVRAWRSSKEAHAPSVVEIGCGDGAIAAALARLGFFANYRGYDISPSGIEQAESRQVPGAEFFLGETPAAETADLVVISHVVEHLEHPRDLLYAARRIAPWVVVEVPTELNAGAPRDYVLDSLGHINKYDSVSIRHLVQSCGFDVVSQFTTNPSCEVARFHGASRRSLMKWRIKQSCLRIAPPIARRLFTYHETLLARSNDDQVQRSQMVWHSISGRHSATTPKVPMCTLLN